MQHAFEKAYKDSNVEEPKEKSEEEKVSEDQKEKEKEPYIEGELIYNEEKGNQDMEKEMEKEKNMIKMEI